MRIVLDTNVLFSALLSDGNARKILKEAIEQRIVAVSSPMLLEELFEALRKKSPLTSAELGVIEEEIRDVLEMVYPRRTIEAARDTDDNRVLETAVEGACDVIVTGDKDLLVLGSYQKILIRTPNDFLRRSE